LSATITTVIPTYRRPLLLRRALTSVVRQTYADFRVCVYDNASGDDTEATVNEIAAGDPRVTYFSHPRNIGGGANFLFGMRRIDTPFFSFLSDDDVLLPHFYETALKGFERFPDALMSAASTVEVSAGGELRYVPLALWQREGVYDPPSGAFAMLDNRHPTWTTILFRREALDQVGYLDLDVGSPSDLDYEMRIAARFPIVVSFRPSGAYVSHPESGSARETGAVVPGYERMRTNIEADDRIDAGVRKRLGSRLARQQRMKLLEIWVKGLVRGDDDVALEAATLLRERFGPRGGGALLVFAWHACTRIAALRALLGAVERLRLRMRARRGGVRISPEAMGEVREALSS
jgi:glycosyltransferase involved in cell wall biosynthesis